jgi:hypothetical protein
MSAVMRIGVAALRDRRSRQGNAATAPPAPLISVEDAMGTLAVVEAVRDAARTGSRISPSIIVEQAA